LGAHQQSTHFLFIEKHVLRELEAKNMLVNASFFGKKRINRQSIGGSAPKPSLASIGWELCPQMPKLLLSSLVSITLKLRSIVSYFE